VIINGAAARLVYKGDTVIIITYEDMPEERARTQEPPVVHVDGNNRIRESQNGVASATLVGSR
jgi:aspartate 1-decarboxylase